MALSEEILKREIEAGKAAIKAHEEGVEIHKIVNKAFEDELKKCTSTASQEE